jgi:D-glycero-D-manno-heptose 1,7-bisphosphate phosphatase
MPADALTGEAAARRAAAPVVVLDRDGVINHESKDFIRTPDEWIPIAGSLEAIAQLTQAGWLVFVATNQSGVGRGLITPGSLAAIHARMTAAIEQAGGRLAGIFCCPHHPDEGCGCRKPAPGLFRQIEAKLGRTIAGCPAVGDSARDLAAARAAGARPILVRTGYGVATAAARDETVETYPDLAAVADALLRETAGYPGHRS